MMIVSIREMLQVQLSLVYVCVCCVWKRISELFRFFFAFAVRWYRKTEQIFPLETFHSSRSVRSIFETKNINSRITETNLHICCSCCCSSFFLLFFFIKTVACPCRRMTPKFSASAASDQSHHRRNRWAEFSPDRPYHIRGHRVKLIASVVNSAAYSAPAQRRHSLLTNIFVCHALWSSSRTLVRTFCPRPMSACGPLSDSHNRTHSISALRWACSWTNFGRRRCRQWRQTHCRGWHRPSNSWCRKLRCGAMFRRWRCRMFRCPSSQSTSSGAAISYSILRSCIITIFEKRNFFRQMKNENDLCRFFFLSCFCFLGKHDMARCTLTFRLWD